MKTSAIYETDKVALGKRGEEGGKEEESMWVGGIYVVLYY